MRITYDATAGAAYVYLVNGTAPGSSKRRVVAMDGKVVLDLDADGRLLGVEILSERLLHPETLSAAEGLDPPVGLPVTHRP